jgi:hypothetical protein
VGDALVALTVFLVAPVVLVACAAFVVTHSLRRANRVGPRRAGPIPLAWLWSPGYAAMLHRRLRYACQVATEVETSVPSSRLHRRQAGAAVDSIAELAHEVVSEAVRLDRQLVPTNRMARGMSRTQALAALEQEVRVVEDAAARVDRLARRRAQLSGVRGAGTLSLTERISAMEAALGELSSG